MNKNNKQNESLWDRVSAGYTGLKTAASNLGATLGGNPAQVTNVQDAKVKQLFNLAQSRMKPFIKNINSKNIITKTAAEIEVKKQLLGFFQDFMKMTGEKKPNNIVAILQQPQYKDISDYLKNKVGVDLSNVVSAPPTKVKAPAVSPSTQPTKKTKSSTAPSTQPTKKTKSSTAPSTLSGYTSKAHQHRIPENKINLTYKEFFV